MEITCTQCGFKADAPDSYEGRRVRCPQCQNIFVCGVVKPTFIVMDDLEDVTTPKSKETEQTPTPEQTPAPEQQQTVPQHSDTTDDTPVCKIAVSSIPKSSVIRIKQPTYETPQVSTASTSDAPSTPTPSAPPVSSEAMPPPSDAPKIKISVASNAPKAEVPIAEYHCGNTQLSLTNRHLMGEIETLVESGKSGLGGKKTYLTRRENISVLLSNISSSTLTDDADVVLEKKKLFRIIAALIFIIILLLGRLVSKINVGTLNAETVIVICICSLVPSLIFLCMVKNDLHYYLTIKVMGFEYKIPITSETTKDCLAFLGKLKTAKMAFEESI